MAYIGVSPSNGVRQKHTYTVSGTSTDTFSGAGAEGISLSYLDSNYVDVYQNGVKLSEADYTATTGTTIVLATGATVSDMIEIVVYDVFSVADTVSKADGGTFDGNVTMAGTITVTGNADLNGDLDVDGTTNLDVVDIDGAVDMASTALVTGVLTTTATAVFNGGFTSNGDTNTFTSSAQDDPVIILENTTNDSNSARFKFRKDRGAAGQDGDDIADVLFNADNDAQEETTFASIRSEIIDASNGTEDGKFKVETMLNGSSTVSRMEFNSAEAIFNQDSQDIDFRVESNGNTNMLFVDAGNNVVCFDTTDVNPAENNVAGVSMLTGGKISASADGNFGLQVNRKSSFGGVIHLRKDGSGRGFLAIFSDSSSGRMTIGNDNTALLFNDSTKQIIPFQSTGVKQDDIISLGNASGRFDNIFATNGSINTSDRNEKQDIEELTDAEKRVAVVAKGLMRKYRWKSKVALKGDKARTHFGIIAQDLQDAFTAESLDASDYAMFCSDTYWDNDEVYVDDDGVSHNVVKSYYTEEEAPDGATKKTRLGVRYSELLAFIISAI